MKNNICLSMAALGAAALSFALPAQAQYNGDLMIGFTAEAGNDLLVDLGPVSSVTSAGPWDLSSLLSGSGYTLSTVSWGVVGNTQNGPGKHTDNTIYTTTSGSAPRTATGTLYGNVNNCMDTWYGLFTAIGAGDSTTIAWNASSEISWYAETIGGPYPTSYVNAYANPNVTGTTTASLWAVDDQGGGSAVLGTFTLGANGVLTFAPPSAAAVTLTITSANNVNTISFPSASGVNYTLLYTNGTGLTAPLSTWPSLGTIAGNGSTESIQDTTTDPVRFYAVQEH
jgi:hypothetical protein